VSPLIEHVQPGLLFVEGSPTKHCCWMMTSDDTQKDPTTEMQLAILVDPEIDKPEYANTSSYANNLDPK